MSVSDDGYWIINGVKTWYKATGTDGADGTNGKDGEDGKDGVTPTIEISNDGYWIINGVKTEYKAVGTDGANGADGKDGVDGKDGADGKDGVDGAPGKDGITPEFKLDGGDIWVSYDGGVTWETLGNVNNPVCQHRDIDDDYICDKCGNPYADGTDVPVDPEHTHSYGEWKYFSTSHEYCDEALYYRTCPGCNVIEWRDGEESDHSYTTVTIAPTCTAGGYDKKTCSECGKEVVFNETAKVAHDYSDTYTIDASHHWIQCTYCADVKDKAEHIINGDGYCIVCEQPVGPTEGVIYDCSIDGTYAEVLGYIGTSTQIVIADTYNGLPVKNIYEKAFYKNTNIISVLIPDSVTTIGDSAFDNCSKLTIVTIPDSVTSIGYRAFNFCSGLTSVTIGDSVTSIASEAFYGCSGLTSVTIGDSVTSIGYHAFYSCNYALYTEYEFGTYIGDASNPYAVLIELTNKNFTTYTIHEDTKHIAYGVFSGCERLTNITMPNGVTSIGDQAFSDCSNLTSVTIPDSVTSIGYRAFYGCSGLTSVTIPDSVTSIGDQAFSYCSKLTSVTIGDSLTSIGDDAFDDCSKLNTVYYAGTADDWENISIGGANYKLTDATRYYYSETEPAVSGNFWHYDENGEIAVW